MTFVDTSGLYAVLDADNAASQEAAGIWRRLLGTREPLVTSSYVLLEMFALVQRRLGMDAVRTLHEDLQPLISIQWVGEAIHASAIASLITANRRQLSLVDCANFAIMRALGIRQAFAFDQHFVDQGFSLAR